jgi:hypothetical protein
MPAQTSGPGSGGRELKVDSPLICIVSFTAHTEGFTADTERYASLSSALCSLSLSPMTSAPIRRKAESGYRWIILFLTCVMMIGNYYCYDIPAALNSQMDDYFGKPGDFETLFSLLYTVYSVPNIILPFFGGYFVDSWGVRICLLIFACLISAGQAVFALGLSLKSWPLMFVGRCIFGFGGENLGVANSAILSVWFEGKELAFAFGLNLSIARLGSVINNLVSPALANSAGIQFALWFGVILCGSSIAAVLIVASVDTHVDYLIESNGGAHVPLVDKDEEEIVLNKGNSTDSRDRNNETIRESLVKGAYDGPNGRRPSNSISYTTDPSYRTSIDAKAKEEITWEDVKSFQPIFWILAVICVVVYGRLDSIKLTFINYNLLNHEYKLCFL